MMRIFLVAFFIGLSGIVDGEEFKIDYKLSPNAKIISDTKYSFVGGRIRYYDLKKSDLKEGDIVISTQDNGFLGKVVRIERLADGYYIEIEDTSMEEAFEQLRIEYKNELKEMKIKKVEKYSNEVDIDRALSDELFKIRFNDFPLYDYDNDPATKNDRITIDGVIKLIGGIEWGIEIEGNSFKGFKTILDVDKRSDFELKISTPIKIPLPFSKEVKLIRYEFMPIIVGPVVFTPIIDLVAGFKINIAGNLVVNLKNNLKARWGVIYSNNKWDGVSELNERSSDGMIKFISAEGEVKGYIGPLFTLNFYNKVGPYIKGAGYLKTTSKTLSFKPLKLSWDLKTGVEAKAGVDVNIFGPFNYNFEKDIARYEVLISSGIFGEKDIKLKVLPVSDFDEGVSFLTPEKISELKKGF